MNQSRDHTATLQACLTYVVQAVSAVNLVEQLIHNRVARVVRGCASLATNRVNFVDDDHVQLRVLSCARVRSRVTLPNMAITFLFVLQFSLGK